MTGLEKMKSQILQEACDSAKEMIRKAKEEAEGIVEEAKEEAKAEETRILLRSQEAIGAHRERVEASKKFTRRTKVLAAKQEVIAQVLAKAYEAVGKMEDAEYFALLLRMLEHHVQPMEGTMYLPQEDCEKLPPDFCEKVHVIARRNGGKLEVSEGAGTMGKGFVLVYGGIEENCTIRAIFETRKEELSDTVCHILFP